MTPECKFCNPRLAAGATIVGSVFVLTDAYPVTPGHRLIIPLRHRSDYFELTAEELADTHEALKQIRAELAAAGTEGYNIGWNCGEVAGQTVAHAHCHLIPRRSGDMADPTGGVRGVIPDRQKYTEPEQVERPRLVGALG